MDYIPNTVQDQQEMMKAIGIEEMEALFADIPEKYRLRNSSGSPRRSRSRRSGST